MNPVLEAIVSLRSVISDIVSADVVSLKEDFSIAGFTMPTDNPLDPAYASTAFAGLVKSNQIALQRLGVKPESAEDLIISMAGYKVLIQMVGGAYFLVVVVGAASNLGMVRLAVKTAYPQLHSVLYRK